MSRFLVGLCLLVSLNALAAPIEISPESRSAIKGALENPNIRESAAKILGIKDFSNIDKEVLAKRVEKALSGQDINVTNGQHGRLATLLKFSSEVESPKTTAARFDSANFEIKPKDEKTMTVRGLKVIIGGEGKSAAEIAEANLPEFRKVFEGKSAVGAVDGSLANEVLSMSDSELGRVIGEGASGECAKMDKAPLDNYLRPTAATRGVSDAEMVSRMREALKTEGLDDSVLCPLSQPKSKGGKCRLWSARVYDLAGCKG